MLRFGLIGAGRIGQLHAGNLARNGDVDFRLIADVDDAATAAIADAHGAAQTDTEALVAAPDLDAVLIASSTDSHADLIEAVAATGKAIFCEKPVDLDVERARRAVAAAARAGVPLAIGFNRRFDLSFRDLKRRLDAGEIGNPETLMIISRDPEPPPLAYLKTSGGLFRDMMIHDFDMARWLLGEDPVELMAYGATLIDPAIATVGDIDTAMVTLRFGSGRLCQITVSRRASYGYDQRIECHGEKGALRANNEAISTVERAGASGFERAPAKPFFMERYEAAYRAELDAFIADMVAGRPASPSGEDGLMALRLADAAQRSHDSGKPVRLDGFGD